MAIFQRNDARDLEVVRRYSAGESAQAIANALHITRGAVYNALKRAGISSRREMHSLTEEQELEVVRRYGAGENATEICRDFTVHLQTIINTLHKHGVETRPELTRRRVPKAEREKIVEACRGGKIIPAVANRFDTSPTTVATILREAGVSLSPGRPRSCAVNDAAFDVLTPESEYWIGFLFADGCVHQDAYGSPVLVVGLAEKDRGHLEKLRLFLSSTHTIATYPPGRQSFGGPTSYFRVRSKRLFDALTHAGIVKKRTRVPIKELAASSHFWRGAVDGDGWLGLSAYAYVGLSGQIPLLKAFQTFLQQHQLASPNITPTESGIWKIQISGAKAEAVLRLLYNDAPTALNRKNIRAQQLIGNTKLEVFYEEPGRRPLSEDPEKDIDATCARLLATPFPYPETLPQNKFDYDIDRLREIEFSLDDKTIRPWSTVGTRLCAAFFPNRYKATRKNSISAFDAWHDENELRKAVCFQIKYGDPVEPARILRAVTLRCRTPTIFRPSVARFIYESFCRPGEVVWDPCAGYGGRLLGAFVAGVHYVGSDVDEETIQGNRNLAEALGASCDLFTTPAENFNPGTVDLVFTSPPYFDREHYSADDSQSWRYGKLDAWVTNFLLPVITRARASLNIGGHLILNIADLRERGDTIPLVARTIETAVEAGFRHVDTLRMPLAAINKTRPFEPVLVFRPQ